MSEKQEVPPSTFDAAVDYVVARFGDEIKEALDLGENPESLAVKAHHSAGRGLRNRWRLWENGETAPAAPLKRDTWEKIGAWRREHFDAHWRVNGGKLNQGVDMHADDVSGEILRAAVRKIAAARGDVSARLEQDSPAVEIDDAACALLVSQYREALEKARKSPRGRLRVEQNRETADTVGAIGERVRREVVGRSLSISIEW